VGVSRTGIPPCGGDSRLRHKPRQFLPLSFPEKVLRPQTKLTPLEELRKTMKGRAIVAAKVGSYETSSVYL
jgi:hypothetical protein